MHSRFVAIAFLTLALVAHGEALACRGPFRSVAEIVNVSSSVFTAEVIRRFPASEREAPVELRVTEVLKGSVPASLRVNGNALVHPNDNCLAIESGQPFPRVSAGEEWIVSGNFDTNRNFLPTSAGNFRLVNSDGKAVEGGRQLLGKFRQASLRVPKKSRNAPQ